jgi:hypothetical protein
VLTDRFDEIVRQFGSLQFELDEGPRKANAMMIENDWNETVHRLSSGWFNRNLVRR